MEINEFLKWILASGGSVSAASFILERIPWFQKQASEAKDWAFFGVASLISIIAYGVVTYVPDPILATVQPFFAIISGLFMTLIIGKLYHKIDKK